MSTDVQMEMQEPQTDEQVQAATQRQVRRKKRVHTLSVLAIRFGFILALLILWQLASIYFPAQKFILSSPTDIIARFGQMIHSGALLLDTEVTFEEVVIGYVIGSSIGLALGFLFGSVETIAEIFEPIVIGFYGIPRIALAPLFIVWLGIGIASKVGIVILLTFFLTFFNTYSGMKEIDRDFVNLARLMGASEWTISRRVVFPAISPYVMVGLKTSVPQAVIGAVVGEFIVSTAGLGYLIRQAAGLFDASGLYVGIVVLLVIVLSGSYILNFLERRLMRWRFSVRSERAAATESN